MKAVSWHGRHDVRVEEVQDPQLLNPRDAIVRVTSAGLGGSDLHAYDDRLPGMEKGDILGHEFMGEVVDTGGGVRNLRPGDRVVVPFVIACGDCWFCRQGLTALCDNSNPRAGEAERLYGFAGAGLFGLSHLFGGYAGGQAEFVRVPFADFGAFKVPPELPDEQLLLLANSLPAGFLAAENCGIRSGDTVAVWGCGPVGLFAARSARLLGAERLIAIDHVSERLRLAETFAGAEPLHYEETDSVVARLKIMTAGRGPDACIDAVGMESHGLSADAWYDRAMQAVHLEGDRPHALREAVRACRKGGTVVVPGFYAGTIDRFPLGAAFAKGLSLVLGQAHVHAVLQPLFERILQGEIKPAAIVTHTFPLTEAPAAYRLFAHQEKGCVKVILKP